MTRRELLVTLALLAASEKLGRAAQQREAEAKLHTVTLLIEGMT